VGNGVMIVPLSALFNCNINVDIHKFRTSLIIWHKMLVTPALARTNHHACITDIMMVG
jgi:hypothetical protein